MENDRCPCMHSSFLLNFCLLKKKYTHHQSLKQKKSLFINTGRENVYSLMEHLQVTNNHIVHREQRIFKILCFSKSMYSHVLNIEPKNSKVNPHFKKSTTQQSVETPRKVHSAQLISEEIWKYRGWASSTYTLQKPPNNTSALYSSFSLCIDSQFF